MPKFSFFLKYKSIPVILVITSVAQIIFEGFRWQLWPLFFANVMLIIIAVNRKQSRYVMLFSAVSLILTFISITAGSLFPVPDPFPITGPYEVGTRIIHYTDFDRHEIYGPDLNAPREIMAQIWYPAVPGENHVRAQWMPDIKFAGPAIAIGLDLPPYALNHLKYVNGNAFLEAPPTNQSKGFPVLIFSHGWDGFKEQNIFQVEELASHGYVVIGINHTYGAVLTVFPDGRQVPTNQDALPSGVTQEEYNLASNILVQQWANDIGFVIDELEIANQPSANWFLSGKLDLNNIGVFGHSTGAGATVEFCIMDLRCKAALTMDLWAEPVSADLLASGVTQPMMLMHSENWDTLYDPARNYAIVGTLVNASANDVIEFTIKDTKHYDFSSLPLLSPLTVNLGLKGPIDGELVLEIINAETVAFFDKYLSGNHEIDIVELSTQYPEVLFGIRP